MRARFGGREWDIRLGDAPALKELVMASVVSPRVATFSPYAASLSWPSTMTRGGPDGLELVLTWALKEEAPPMSERVLVVSDPLPSSISSNQA